MANPTHQDRSWVPAAVLRAGLLAITVAVCLLNGTYYSPAFDATSYYLHTFSRGSVLFSPTLLFYATPLMISAMTFLIAGIPAAIYERVRGLPRSSPISLAIWLAAALLLTLPTLMKMIGED